jgi:predicted metal-dependent peptidase
MHLMMNHAHRQDGRNLMAVMEDGREVPLWNIAADMAINQVLREMGISLPDGACYPPRGKEDQNAEQLYEHLAKESPKKRGSGGTGQAASGCGVMPGDGTPEEQEAHAEEWEKVAAQARSLSAGTVAGNALARLFERKEALRWESLCRSLISRAVAMHGRDSQTWTKRSRRSTGRVIFPGWKCTKATVCGVIDASGSVSDEALSRGVDQLQRIAEIAEARLYIVVHDYGVQTSGWVNGRDRRAIERTVRGRGGTEFDQAYREVSRVPRRFDMMVHLTDGECFGAWPARPRNVQRLVVALLGECRPSQTPDGATVVRVKL